MPRLTIITGHSGAGKSTLARSLSQARLAPILNLGDVVWRMVVDHGIQPTSRAHAGGLFSSNFGTDALGLLVLFALQRNHEEVIIDGLRIPSILEMLKRTTLISAHIHVETPRELRLQRLLARDGIIHDDGFADDVQFLGRRASILLPGYPVVRPSEIRANAAVSLRPNKSRLDTSRNSSLDFSLLGGPLPHAGLPRVSPTICTR